MKTIKEQIDELRKSPDVSELVDHIKATIASDGRMGAIEMAGAAFALESLVIDAAGGDIRKTTAAFFLGLCGNDMTEALAFMVEQKRRHDAEAAAAQVKP